MTQQQLVQEFRTYPKAQKSVIIRQLLRIFEEDLEETEQKVEKELSIKERKAAIDRLRGIAKTENPPMTKEEVREDYYNYLAEKYK
ncbi:MAG TPA: hypothetical protein PKE69_22685 [Pyrinomonadaceae bacterium]|nr:hypothetical protein [Pyrinomonadaceae bacterium]